MDSFDITKYLNMAVKRIWWITIPFLLSLLGGLGYGLVTPKIYEARTLILVQSQKVPEDFVRAIVSTNVEDRIRTITQQVTSRTNLEKIIKEYGLSSELPNTLGIDGVVMSVRERIKIDVSSSGSRRKEATSAFTISFQGRNPKKVMQVTNALASNFISENLKIRESQAIGTSGFLADELESVEKRLKEKEGILKQYREKFMGGLPEQLDTNLRILERLQAQVEQLQSNLRDAENRKIMVQQGIDAERKRIPGTLGPLPPSLVHERRDLTALKNELASLEAKYTEKHPDVIRLKKMIDNLEGKEPQTETKPVKDKKERATGAPLVAQAMVRQVNDINLEINSLKPEIKKLKAQIKWYQTKVEETPKREQELLSLERDYGNLKELYNSLLSRKLEAEIAVSMEKKQKGEQLRVIDPAKLPSLPIKPDYRKIILMTLALALGLGGGLAYLVEYMDTSYRTPDDAEKELQVPVLISLPIRYTEKELRWKKRKRAVAIVSVTVGFVLSAIGIVIAAKGLETTLSFVKQYITELR